MRWASRPATLPAGPGSASRPSRCQSWQTKETRVRLETLLPLGKVDPGLRAPEIGLDLDAVAADARLLEELGYGSVVIEETKQDPYVVMALAAQATTRLQIGTAIAMAFP